MGREDGRGIPPGAAGSSGATDPLFQGEERTDRTPRRAALLFQFFLFPLLIVMAAVGVFLLFGAIGGAERSPGDLLDAVMTGGENVQKQAVQDLVVRLVDERRKVDEGRLPAADAFYAAPGFQSRLVAAYQDAFRQEKGPQRQAVLTLCLGAVGAPDLAGPLAQGLEPKTDVEVRRATVTALGQLRGDGVTPTLVTALEDPDDAVRSLAIQGLSRRRGPDVVAALRPRLADPKPLVQANAASALALLGDPSGKAIVASLLDPAWVATNIVAASSGTGGAASPELQVAARRNALTNGLRGAHALRADDLKPRVEALATDGDEVVRRLALQVLDNWGKAP